MVRKELGQQVEEPIAPATEQTPEELALAQEIRKVIGELLGGQTSRSVNFNVRKARDCGYNGGESPLKSDKWPVPSWCPRLAQISKEGDKYTVEVRGRSQRFFPG